MEAVISRTVEVLLGGGTILYPTDTIWGLGCDARNAEAVEHLYAIKGRDRSKSMLVLAGELAGLCSLTVRPTTYILPECRWRPLLGFVAANLPADDGTLGVRIPRHAFCQEVIRRLGAPLVSTSANLSGQPSPTSWDDIDEALKARVDYCVPPLPELLSKETACSRIVRLLDDGTEEVIRP